MQTAVGDQVEQAKLTVYQALTSSETQDTNIVAQALAPIQALICSNDFTRLRRVLNALHTIHDKMRWAIDSGIESGVTPAVAFRMAMAAIGATTMAGYKGRLLQELEFIHRIRLSSLQRSQMYALADYYISLCDAAALRMVDVSAIEVLVHSPVTGDVKLILAKKIKQLLAKMRIVMDSAYHGKIESAKIKKTMDSMRYAADGFYTKLEHASDDGTLLFKLVYRESFRTALDFAAKAIGVLLFESWARQVSEHYHFKQQQNFNMSDLDPMPRSFEDFVIQHCFLQNPPAPNGHAVAADSSSSQLLYAQPNLPDIRSIGVFYNVFVQMLERATIVMGPASPAFIAFQNQQAHNIRLADVTSRRAGNVIRPNHISNLSPEMINEMILRRHYTGWMEIEWPY
jgi:hypothetical protein